MATLETVSKAVSGKELVPGDRLHELLERVDYRKRFDEALGEGAPIFIASIVSLYKSNNALRQADPNSVIASALIAATLKLPINQNLGFAAIVPYGGIAQFQMMAKGFIQLAIRTGQYETINSSEVYADELDWWNPITGEIQFKPQDSWKQRYVPGIPVGYFSYFKLKNGFKHCFYMTDAQLIAHGKRYSKSFMKSDGPWQVNPNAMKLKTVTKLLLSKWGLLSVDLEKALKYDQATVSEVQDEAGDPVILEYPDAPVEVKTIEGDQI